MQSIDSTNRRCPSERGINCDSGTELRRAVCCENDPNEGRRGEQENIRRKKRGETFHTWTVGHCVKVAVGQHEVLSSTLGLQTHGDVGDPVVVAGKTPQEVDGEAASWPLDIHRQLVGPCCRLRSDAFNLLQQVLHRQNLVLSAADRPRPHTGDLLQVVSK